ncbi:MAG TPA: bifunctional riboflavin kinase/FAD synthetase [Gemmataceae bacterium]|nr:bifunctional riboflavin kinase/FAD synthetase [Gemmataceae bacterium]
MAVYTIDWDAASPEDCRGGAVTIGNFDGVHRGHAALLAETRRQAAALPGPAIALTFDPHPIELLRPSQAPPRLTTSEDRSLLLLKSADHVIVLRANHEMLGLRAAEFFAEVIQKRLQARALVEGTNFGFGRGREGDVETLARLCEPAGIHLTVVPPVILDGIEVSSSRIRSALMAGNVREAAHLLGRPYRLHGRVGSGQRRGQKLGFPTANLEQVKTLIPGDGVYAVRVPIAGMIWPGAANIGPNPTFGEEARKVEVHLIGYQADLYGKSLAVVFVERLRDTRPFKNVAELVEQLKRDIEQARRIASEEAM